VGRQSKAVELFLKQSEDSRYKYVKPQVTGDGEFLVSEVKRPSIGESGIGLPLCFDQTIHKVDVKSGMIRITHPVTESDVPVLSTTWVQVAEGAHVAIIEEFEGTGTAVQSGVSVITTAKDAVVDYIRDIRLKKERTGILKCVIEAFGPMTRAWQVARTSGHSDASLIVRLLTKGARVDIMDVAMGNGSSEINNDISVEHKASNTKSNVISRALSFESARISGKGNATLPEIAAGAETSVKMKGLLMGTGDIEMTPKLNINQLDVIASHGASIGPLDPNEMFYMNSRGIDKTHARRLLLNAFVMPLLSGMPSDPIIESIINDLNKNIGGIK